VLAPAVLDALPRAHGAHAVDPASATHPLGQSAQLPNDAHDAQYVPTGHGSHADCAAFG